MLYTKKGDGGTTKFFGCDQRRTKASATAEALGALDELNSWLGYVRAVSQSSDLATGLMAVQHNLFIVQAEVAGADKKISLAKVTALENAIDAIEKELPPIKSFFLPGGCPDGALLDYARTVVRRAERRVIRAQDEGAIKLGPDTLAYLNRLSSYLYALARLVNRRSGIKEEPPHYQ